MKASTLIIAALCCLTFLANGDDSARKERLLECFWTEQPPVLDGIMDEACWAEAPVADKFILHQSADKAPANKTEVRACYDAENIYFFWTMHEKNMDKLHYGPPEDIRDNLDWNGDVAELFLAPGDDNKQFYQLAVSPQGARFDSFMRDTFFNADWQVKTKINENSWTIEMAIPFAAFLRHAEVMGTPPTGQVWGLQFCRDQGYLHEWSTWRNLELPSFLRPEGFANLRFAGRKEEPPPIAVKNEFTEIFFGAKQRFGFTLSRHTPGLLASACLLHNDKQVAEEKIKIETDKFYFDFDVLGGGTWELKVLVSENGKKIYHALAQKELPTVIETFQTIAAEKIEQSLRDSDYPGKDAFIRELESLQKECLAATESLQQASTLERQQWEELIALYQKVNVGWEKLSFVSQLIKMYQSLPTPRPHFVLGQAAAQEKVYQDSLYQGAINAPLRMRMAGRETESQQLIVIPFGEKLDAVKLSFSDLLGPEGSMIKAENCRWFAIEYVKINVKPPSGKSSFQAWEPDILHESQAFAVEVNSQRPVWLDIYLPAGTPKGLFHGTVEIAAGKNKVSIPLQIESFGFDLPEKTSLQNDFWLSPTLSWEKFFSGFGDNGYSPELHRKHAQVLGRYRVNPFVFHHAVYWHPSNIKVFREENGSFSFDFSKWEEYLDTGIEFGGNVFPASMGCGADFFNRVVANHPVIDKKNGKEGKLYEYLPELAEAKKRLADRDYVGALKNNRFYMDFMAEYLKLLKKKELLEISAWEYFDEPSTNVRWEAMLKTHAFLKENFPQIRLFAYSVEPGIERSLKKALGYIDTWAPGLSTLRDEKKLQEIKRRQEKFSEGFIFYTCTSRRDSFGNHTPFMYYYNSYLGPRMHAWMAHKYAASGFMSYMLNSITADNMPKAGKTQKLWPETAWLAGRWHGCGTLIYPGPNQEAIPSMRLASFRDGLEDYEYFTLLRKLQAYIDQDKHQQLYQQIEQELEIEEAIIKDVFVWTKNPALLDAKRQRIAALIIQAQAVIDAETIR